MSSKKSSNCCDLGDLMTSHPMCVLRAAEAEIRSTLLISRGVSNIRALPLVSHLIIGVRFEIEDRDRHGGIRDWIVADRCVSL